MKFLAFVPMITAIWAGSVLGQSDLPWGYDVGKFASIITDPARNFANYTSQIVDGDRNDQLVPSYVPLFQTSYSILFLSLYDMVIYDFLVLTARDDSSVDAQNLQNNLTSILTDISAGLDNLKNKASVMPKAGGSIVANLKVYDSTVHYFFAALEVLFPNDKPRITDEESKLRQKITDALKALGDSKATRTSIVNIASTPTHTSGPKFDGTAASNSVSATESTGFTTPMSASSSGSPTPSSATDSASLLVISSTVPRLKVQPSSGTTTSAQSSHSTGNTGQGSALTTFQVTVTTTVAPVSATASGRRRSWNKRARQL